MNQINITCNPYTNRTCETTPPQEYIELWEDAVCGIKYNETFVDEDQCPKEYEIQPYQSIDAMEADGALLTHCAHVERALASRILQSVRNSLI